MNNDLASEIQKLTSELENLKKIKEKLEKKCRDLEAINGSHAEALAKIEAEAAKKIKVAEKRVFEVEEEFGIKEAELRDKLKKDKENYLKDHLEYVRKVQEEFEILKHLHQGKVDDLVLSYRELQEAFQTRPSRPEDLELIEKLKEDNTLKTEELRQAIENLKLFKLELLNREDNYNKMFNGAPNVGVFNVLDHKVTMIFNKGILNLINRNQRQ